MHTSSGFTFLVRGAQIAAASVVALVVGCAPIAAQTSIAPSPESSPAPPGRLVDIGGWKLHLNCTGATAPGSPTVVFESGAGGTSFDWYLVQQQVSQFARACSYDRAGTAWSDVGPHPRTVRQMEYELHTLLANAGVPGPYVLVGHSFGGILVRNFQAQFPSDVAGMVLVDVASDDSRLVHFGKLVRMRELASGKPIPPIRTGILPSERSAESAPTQHAVPLRQALPAPLPSDSNRPVAQPVAPVSTHRLPPDVAAVRDWASRRREVGTTASDGDYTGQEFAELYEARKAHRHVLGDLPLVVLIAARRQQPQGLPPEWLVSNDEVNKQAEELALMSSGGRFIYAANSTHAIANDEPDVVTAEIRAVLAATRRR